VFQRKPEDEAGTDDATKKAKTEAGPEAGEVTDEPTDAAVASTTTQSVEMSATETNGSDAVKTVNGADGEQTTAVVNGCGEEMDVTAQTEIKVRNLSFFNILLNYLGCLQLLEIYWNLTRKPS